MKYTVTDPENSAVCHRGLSAMEAAQRILEHGGCRFEIRLIEGERLGREDRYEVWTNSAAFPREWHWVTGTYAWAESMAAAWPELAQQVVRLSANWRGAMLCAPDDEYQASADA